MREEKRITVDEQSASTIHNALFNPIYKLYSSFLSYILPIVTKLNLEFQTNKDSSLV